MSEYDSICLGMYVDVWLDKPADLHCGTNSRACSEGHERLNMIDYNASKHSPFVIVQITMINLNMKFLLV